MKTFTTPIALKLEKILILFLFLWLMPSNAHTLPIHPGQGVGPYEIGQPYSQYSDSLGKPNKVVPSPSDPSRKYYFHDDKALGFLVQGDGTILGIMTSAPVHQINQQIGPGTKVEIIKSQFGPGIPREGNSFVYPDLGLGIQVDDANLRITHINVVRPEADNDPAKSYGDRLTVPGSRTGSLQLGMLPNQVARILGPSPQLKSIPGTPFHVASYQARGIKIVWLKDRVDGIAFTTGDFIDKRGITVGVTQKEVEEAYGAPTRSQQNVTFYDNLGLAFIWAGHLVQEIQVFYPANR